MAEFYGHGENNQFDSFVYFFNHTHQTYKESQNKNIQQLTESTE